MFFKFVVNALHSPRSFTLLHFFLNSKIYLFIFCLLAGSDLHIAAVDIAVAAISLANFFIDCYRVM